MNNCLSQAGAGLCLDLDGNAISFNQLLLLAANIFNSQKGETFTTHSPHPCSMLTHLNG